MLGVAAMATQNGLVKLTLPGAPSTAVMTTNTTQLIIDLATLARGRGEPEDLGKARRRAGVTFPCVVGFVGGCTAGAVLEFHCGLWALTLPVVLAVLAVPLGELRGDDEAMAARRTGTAGGHGAPAHTTEPDRASDLGQRISNGRDPGGIPDGRPSPMI
jgi:hypothetical protein